MTLDCSVCGQVRISMFECIDEILTAFDTAEPKGAGAKSSVAPDNLFTGNKDWKASSSKRTKHVNIRCFFIADQIMKKELSVVWCPTGNMIGDHATEPLQGAAFKKFRDLIIGMVPV